MASELDHSAELITGVHRMDVKRIAAGNEPYQRVLSERKVDRMVAYWEPDAVGILHLAPRPQSRFEVVDGQHRLAAMMRLGIGTCLCLIIMGKSPAEEARLWLMLNDYLPVSAKERFTGSLAAEDEEALTIKDIVEQEGFSIAGKATRKKGRYSGEPGSIASVAELIKAYRNGVLRETLQLVNTCWSGQPESSQGYVLGGVAGLLNWVHHHPEGNRFNMAAAVDRWREHRVSAIVGISEDRVRNSRKPKGARSPDGFSDALVEIYNYKRQLHKLLPFTTERKRAPHMDTIPG